MSVTAYTCTFLFVHLLPGVSISGHLQPLSWIRRIAYIPSVSYTPSFFFLSFFSFLRPAGRCTFWFRIFIFIFISGRHEIPTLYLVPIKRRMWIHSVGWCLGLKLRLGAFFSISFICLYMYVFGGCEGFLLLFCLFCFISFLPANIIYWRRRVLIDNSIDFLKERKAHMHKKVNRFKRL